MRSLILPLSATLLLTLTSCGSGSGEVDGQTLETVELTIGAVPADYLSVDWALYDDTGTLLASGTVGPPLESNQVLVRYRGVPRNDMYLTIEVFLTGGSSCGVVQTPPFWSSDSDVVFTVDCGAGLDDLSALVILTSAGPSVTTDDLAFTDFGAPDTMEIPVRYYADIVDASLLGHSLELTWQTATTRSWVLYTATGLLDTGDYVYNSTVGTFSFSDATGGACAQYDYDVTLGVLADLPRVLTLQRVSGEATCTLGGMNLSGIWKSTTPLP